MPAALVRQFVVASCLLVAGPAWAQYAETPRPLPGAGSSIFGAVYEGSIRSAVQMGRRLFLGGAFSLLSPPTGSAVVVDPSGTLVPGAFPVVAGDVSQIVPDGLGGWIVVGSFTGVNGQPANGFARITPERTVDARYRVAVDGAIRFVALAHGRIYLAGQFTRVNGVGREGLAALSQGTGQLTAWGAGFGTGGRPVNALSVSSIGVYLSAGGYGQSLPPRLWGLDAATGRLAFARTMAVSTIAASSARVYVGAYGYERPIWAVDPATGQDTAWTIGLQFQYQSGTYGDYTTISAMLLDEGRLYFAGRFGTTDGRSHFAAVDADTGTGLSWRASGAGWYGTGLARVGPAIVLTYGSSRALAYYVTTGVQIAFEPAVFGYLNTVAAAPEGVVIGGRFTGVGGLPRAGLAAIDLDTFAIEPWTSNLSPSPQGFASGSVEQLATDGTWLFARTGTGRIAKIDPATGAVVAERTLTSANTDMARMVVAGGEIVVTTFDRVAEVGVITIADWSYRVLPVTLETAFAAPGWITDLAVEGDTVYLSGSFATVSGQSRPWLAAVHRLTGAVLPWRPAPDAGQIVVRTAGGSVWAGGSFRRIGGTRRRGLAALDPATGAARPWNPDVAGVLTGGVFSPYTVVSALAIGDDGALYAGLGYQGLAPQPSDRPTVGGQRTGHLVAFSTATGRRLTWRPLSAGLVALTPDCLLASGGCLPRAVPAPTDLGVTQAGATVALSWTLPAATARTGVRVEVGSREGLADLLTVDLPPTQTSFGGVAPTGSYVARVRSLAGPATSAPTPDVSFAVGAGRPAAPLDAIAVASDTQISFAWQPPSTGAPATYELEAGVAEGRRDGVLTIPGSATSLTVDVPPGRYWARLVSVNATGRSAAGQELLIDTTYRQICSGVPLAPAGLSASVSGRTVTLTWQPPADDPQVDPQKVVAASAPGLADLAIFDVPASATSFSVAAPPGTYYVRVIADNQCGASASSNEVLVVVP